MNDAAAEHLERVPSAGVLVGARWCGCTGRGGSRAPLRGGRGGCRAIRDGWCCCSRRARGGAETCGCSMAGWVLWVVVTLGRVDVPARSTRAQPRTPSESTITIVRMTNGARQLLVPRAVCGLLRHSAGTNPAGQPALHPTQTDTPIGSGRGADSAGCRLVGDHPAIDGSKPWVGCSPARELCSPRGSGSADLPRGPVPERLDVEDRPVDAGPQHARGCSPTVLGVRVDRLWGCSVLVVAGLDWGREIAWAVAPRSPLRRLPVRWLER